MITAFWRRLSLSTDPILFLVTMTATILGVFAIWDAGYAQSIVRNKGEIPREFYVQLLATTVSLVAGACAAVLPISLWKKLARPLLLVSIALLLVLLIPGVATTRGGATSWISFGSVDFQPSEFAKIAVILYLAAVFSVRKPFIRPKVRHWADWIDRVVFPKLVRAWPLFVVLFIVLKIEREPDLGGAAIILSTALLMMWMGGVSAKSMALLAVTGLVGVTTLAKLEPYRMERITSHGARWESGVASDQGYQSTWAELGMADGGLTGVGLGNGRAKHYLPAATTDYIMATVAEEFGLIGALVAIGLVALVVWRLIALSRYTQDPFARYVLLGVASWLTVQCTVNVMVANGTLPPIGIPFPFFSSGGSSLLILWLALGICQSAAMELPAKETAVEGRRYGWRHRRSRLSGA